MPSARYDHGMTMGRVKWWVAVASALALVVAKLGVRRGWTSARRAFPASAVRLRPQRARSCVPTCADDAGMAMCVGGIHGTAGAAVAAARSASLVRCLAAELAHDDAVEARDRRRRRRVGPHLDPRAEQVDRRGRSAGRDARVDRAGAAERNAQRVDRLRAVELERLRRRPRRRRRRERERHGVDARAVRDGAGAREVVGRSPGP